MTTAPSLCGLDSLLDRLREQCAAFEKSLEALPPARPCRHAGHGMAHLDRAASLRTAAACYVCPVCEAETRRASLQRRLAAAGIPADVHHATLANFITDRPGVKSGDGLASPARFLEKAQDFQAGRVRNLVLAGTPGIGKGHLAAALCMQALQGGQTVRWTDCARLFEAWHRAYGSDSTRAVAAAHTRPHLLVLDEVALRDLPADGEEILFTILDARHKAARRTLLLGNRPAKPTRDWLGHRLSDRLRSGGIAFCYGEWDSMRGSPLDGAGW